MSLMCLHVTVHVVVICLVTLVCSETFNDAVCTTECNCEFICVGVAHDVQVILDCLEECGFAAIPNLYNATTLSAIYDKFFVEFNSDDRDNYGFLPGNTLRGHRDEYVMPHFGEIEGFEHVIYNPLIAESALRFMFGHIDEYDGDYGYFQEPADSKVVLDTFTVIDAPGEDDGGDVDQEFHSDGDIGIKIQIPLMDVNYRNGPVEIISLKAGLCPTIKGVGSLGTATIYQQNAQHRGSKNNADQHRPVLDMSFLYFFEHLWQDYVYSQFRKEVRKDMAKHQVVFDQLCEQSTNCPGAAAKTFIDSSWTKQEIEEQYWHRKRIRDKLGNKLHDDDDDDDDGDDGDDDGDYQDGDDDN